MKISREIIESLEAQVEDGCDYLNIPQVKAGQEIPESKIHKDLLLGDLGHLKYNSPETCAHSMRTFLYAIRVLDFLGAKNEEYRKFFAVAALLHDLGKFCAFEALRGGRYNEQDAKDMKWHPRWSADFIRSYGEIPAAIVERHHFWQRAPYPAPKELTTAPTPEVEVLSKVLGIIDNQDAAATRENNRLRRGTFDRVKALFTGRNLPSRRRVRRSLIREYGPLEIVYEGENLPEIGTTGEQLIKSLYSAGIFGAKNPLNPFKK